MSNEPISREAELLIQLGEMGSKLWKARDRAWKLARERSRWKLDCLEQCKLLAMGADREERLLHQVAFMKSQISNLKSP
jgi:hypothetical protein